jgi:uncharacterized membrane protein (UPF0127 family)
MIPFSTSVDELIYTAILVVALLRNWRYIIGFRKIVLVLSFVLGIASVQTIACPLQLPTSTVSIKGYTLTVGIASTPAARICGLSNRFELPENHGMLFIYPDLRNRSFWMKDTYVPLSIAFLDESGRIINLQDMIPMQTEKRYCSSGPAKYALEVNRGWFDAHEIVIGETVEMKLPPVMNIQ